MKKETHMAFGLAVSTIAIMPTEFQSLAVCICGSAIGSVISDIDVSSSKPRKTLNKLISFSIAVIAIFIAIEAFFKIGIYGLIESQTNLYRMLFGYVTFLLLSIYGASTKHRTYTHSIIGVISFTGVMWLILPSLALPFCIGMISHILLDTLNTKKVRILYPNKKIGIAFKVCLSDGKGNALIGIISTIVFIAELIVFALWKIHFIL